METVMNASFEEKSVWVQLASLLLSLGAYFVVAGHMLSAGVDALPVYVPVFTIAVILIVLVNIAGHIVIALMDGPAQRDERDRLIGWRSESNTSWILGVGVIMAITGLIIAIPVVWIAHGLLLTLFIAEVAKYTLQLFYYRRGV
ncbi:MAG: hypothetical protein RhofKO_24230 [Rhodothermales bacterium]